MLLVNYIVNRVFSSRTYILSEERRNSVWLVDCGDIEEIFNIIGDTIIEGVLLTHSHSDHIYGLNKLLECYPHARIITNEYGYGALVSPKLNISRYHTDYDDIVVFDRRTVEVVSEGEEIEVLGQIAHVFETPGHDPSCLCFQIDNYFFTGDSYIPGVKVFTGFPYSEKLLAHESLTRILTLSNGLQVCPGHEVVGQKLY